MKVIYQTLTILLVLSFTGLASGEVITFDNPWGQAGFNLVNQGSNGVEIVYSVSSMALEDLDVNGQVMKTVHIPGVILPNNEGAPNLPGQGRVIAIPEGASAQFRIVEYETVVYPNIDLAPAAKIPFENDDSPPIYKKDPGIYSQNANYPENAVMLSEPSEMRGVDYVSLGITPFQYNPVTKELLVYKNLRVEVDFIGGNGHFGEERLRNRYWEPILQQNIYNYASLPKADFDRKSNSDTEDYEYIIIVPDDPNFLAWADTLKAWRTLQGIRTGVVTLSEIGGNNSALIENYIDNAYYNWDIPPAAVLLLSDYQSSGLAYGITAPVYDYGYYACVSDNFYADVDNDHLPDVILARMTAQNDAHLSTMITKMLDYERNPPTAPNFYDEPITAGGWQTERWFILCTEICWGYMHNELGKNPVREYAIYSGSPGNQWSTNPNTYMLLDYFGPDGLGYIPQTPGHLNDWGANATRVNNDINSGAFMLLHRDHGGVTGWGEPDYDINDLGGLNNDMYPFVLSINCLTGKYNYGSQCFTEAFHRMEHGALGLTAASEVSYSFVNDTYIFGLMDCMWPDFDPGYGETDLVGAENLRPSFANASGKYYLHASNWPYNPDNKDETYYLFHHHGDAFITMYSEVPQEMTVSHSNILFSGFSYFTVTADEGALIGLTVDGEVIGVAEGTGGPVDVPITPQLPGETMTVTVTKANYYRYEQQVDIIPPEGYGVFEGYVTDLVTGDGLEGMVTVTNRDPQIVAHCQPDGYYYMYVPADTVWQLRAEYTDDYLPSFAENSVTEDDTVTQNFQLEPKVEVILMASFGNPMDVSYRTFYFHGSWDNDGFYDPNWSSSFSPMRDDGVAPDQIAGDGVFTGSILLAADVQNTYSWAIYSENYVGEDAKLQDGADFQILSPDDPPVVPILEVNPSGNENNWTLTFSDISGNEVDLIPGYGGDPTIWYKNIFIPQDYTIQFHIKVMHSDAAAYGQGGPGGPRFEFTPPQGGSYTIYFSDETDIGSAGASLIASPSWVEADLMPGGTATREFVLRNEGGLDVNFQIPDDFGDNKEAATTAPDPGPYASYEYTGPKPASQDEPVGEPVITGQGGPDEYGYKWIDSNEPGGPEYNWVDITGIGTPISMSDDDNEGPFNLPFSFNFYGTNFNSFRICSNGWISFTSTSTDYSNDPIPSSGAPDNLIAPMWDDFNPSTGGMVYYYTSADSAIVAWVDVPHYYNTGSYTFEVIITSGNAIYYQYENLNGDLNSATVGIQNANGTDGLQIVYNQSYLENGLAVRLAAGWLDLEPMSGIIPAGGETTITAMMDAGALTVGDYEALITVNAWDDMHELPSLEIPAYLHVLNQIPTLSLAMHPDSEPVQVVGGSSFDYDLMVTNNTQGGTTYDGWLMLTLPDQSTFGPLNRVNNVPIEADVTQYYDLIQFVPGFAPLGDYIYHSYVGDYPSYIVDEASFPFEVIQGTLGRGINDWTVKGFDAGDLAGEPAENLLPTEYSLSQNYPNPFNAQSIINYALPQAGKVELSVYNLLGQRVETLVNTQQPAGYHSITWDASEYASGIYFYKLNVGDRQFVKRMMLIK